MPASAVAPGQVPTGCAAESPLAEVIIADPDPTVVDLEVTAAGRTQPCAVGPLSAQ